MNFLLTKKDISTINSIKNSSYYYYKTIKKRIIINLNE